jgi:hypothetical protein
MLLDSSAVIVDIGILQKSGLAAQRRSEERRTLKRCWAEQGGQHLTRTVIQPFGPPLCRLVTYYLSMERRIM